MLIAGAKEEQRGTQSLPGCPVTEWLQGSNALRTCGTPVDRSRACCESLPPTWTKTVVPCCRHYEWMVSAAFAACSTQVPAGTTLSRTTKSNGTLVAMDAVWPSWALASTGIIIITATNNCFVCLPESPQN